MTDRSNLLYLGFAGHGNLGDDVIYESLARVFPDQELPMLPVRTKDMVRGLPKLIGFRGRERQVLLGGGTVLGRFIWRRHIGRIRQLVRPNDWFMIGAGVEDPDFVGTERYTSWDELREWSSIFSSFDAVTVRGPRSQEILSTVGVQSRMVGDPALLLQLEAAPETVDEREVVINVTGGEDQWGGRALDWTGSFAPVVHWLKANDLRVSYLIMEEDDVEWTSRLMGLTGTAEATVYRPADSGELMGILGRVGSLIGTRLHSNVIAAAVSTPSISLEYRPKCRDFMASIAQDHNTFRVDQLDTEKITTALSAILDNREDVKKTIDIEVNKHRESLREEAGRIRSKS